MSDADQTIYSGGGPSPTDSPPKRNPLLVIGGVGCLILLCAGLVVGGGVYFMRDRLEAITGLGSGDELPVVGSPEAGSTTVAPDSTPATDEAEVELEPTDEAAEVTETEIPVAESETPTPLDPPDFGNITFALGASEAYDPIEAGLSFTEGITEIHAIFDYSGMSGDYTWQRIWYLDGNEILNTSAEWSGDERGRFDYFIDAGGDPLSPGEWELELYVQNELMASGSFIIEPDESQAIAQAGTATAEAETEAETPTVVPTRTVAPTATEEAGGGGTYQLAFTKWDGGSHNLYVADTNGSGERFIIGRTGGPSWTPDGRNIFFYGQEGIDRQTVEGVEYDFDGISNGVVAIDMVPFPANIGEVKLTQAIDWKEGTARTTTVSPNGQMVAFDAKPGGGDYRIFFLGTSDNQQFKFQILGEQASWSPDSQKIVYRSGRDGITGIWISNRDDSGHTNITQGGSDSFPAWSPDGKTIAFSRDEGGDVDIYTMNVDGTNLKRLTEAKGPDTLPVYTPSGDIVFRSARSGSWSIWKMSGSGTNQQEIIPNAGVGPDWTYSRMSVR